MRVSYKALLACAAALAVLGGCSTKGGRPHCPTGKLCLFEGNGSDPDTLDPALSQTTWEDRIISDAMVGLVQNDASGNVAEVQPSTVGSNARANSLSVTVQLPGGGSSAPIALGASAGDIVVATQGQDDCTVTLEPQTR